MRKQDGPRLREHPRGQETHRPDPVSLADVARLPE
jgi:hypothetical protein